MNDGNGTKSVLDILKEAKALISDPEHWCQGGYAFDIHGDLCRTKDDNACRWCALGAVRRFAQNYETETKIYNSLSACAKELGKYDIILLNDKTDHPTVMKAFDCAISRAERT